MRERLTPQKIRTLGAPNAMLPDDRKDTPIDRYYFDRVISLTNDTIMNAVFPGAYGPFPLLAPPENVIRSIVTNAAVVGSPSAYFRFRFYWTFSISDGSVQEFGVDTLTGMGTANGVETLTSTVKPGVRYTPYGSIDDPEPVRILVKQGSQLQVAFFGGNPLAQRDTPNVLIRLKGMHEFGRIEP